MIRHEAQSLLKLSGEIAAEDKRIEPQFLSGSLQDFIMKIP